MPEFDVVVIGAGPAGTAFTMSMMDFPYSIALIDKSVFPRDKVCGDAIPGRAVRIIRESHPDTSKRFSEFQEKHRISGAKAVTPGGKSLALYYQTEGYTSTRMAFDNFLLEEARQNDQATFYLGKKVEKIYLEKAGVAVRLEGQEQPITAKLIIGADGAHSVVARHLSQHKLNRSHHCGAVRAYFQNVQGIGVGRIEAFLLKNYLPGYFWVFPLGNGLFNVGFGMLSKDIAEKRINLRESFAEIIRTDPKVAPLFEKAQQLGKVEGFGLPLGSRRLNISGDRYLLTGDAASLVDPATGEGIGNAMLSGKIAARVALKALAEQNYSSTFLKQYDRQLYRKIGAELRNKYLIQRLLKDRQWLIDFIVGQVAANPILQKITKRLF